MTQDQLIDRGPAAGRSNGRPIRFTSNIVGPIFLAADLFCLAASVPVTLYAYDLLVGDRVIASVHVFAFAVLSASYLLLRSSKRAYRRTLVDLMHEQGDALVDAVISSLLASALVWQFGLIDNAYSAMIVKVPSRRATMILLANSDGLAIPFQLDAGDVTRSPFALVLLKMLL